MDERKYQFVVLGDSEKAAYHPEGAALPQDQLAYELLRACYDSTPVLIRQLVERLEHIECITPATHLVFYGCDGVLQIGRIETDAERDARMAAVVVAAEREKDVMARKERALYEKLKLKFERTEE